MASLVPDRSALGWWALGLGLAAVVGYVLYAFLGTVVLGIFLYYVTRPIYQRVRQRVRPSSLAAAVSLFALALPALLLVGYTLLVAIRELAELTAGEGFDPARYVGAAGGFLDRVVDPAALLADPSSLFTADTLRSALVSVGSVTALAATVGFVAIQLFVVLAIAFYLLRDDAALSRWARSQFGDRRGVLSAYLRAVDADLHSVFFGNILNAVITGAIGVLTYSLLNLVAPSGLAVPAPALLGLLAGAASLIPIVGMKLVYLPVGAYMAARAALVVGTETLWFVVAFFLVSLIVVDTIPDLVLRPYVSGRNLHVGSLMLAYVLGPLLFGWYGLFLLPMVLVLVIHFARIVLPEMLDGEPIRPASVDPTYVDGEGRLEGAGSVPASARAEEE